MSLSGRRRVWLGVVLVVGYAGAGFGGYLHGRSTGADLAAAEARGTEAGLAAGRTEGTQQAAADGFARSRDRAYAAAYREAYRLAFREQNIVPPAQIPVRGLSQ